jgi:hypothetical protein
MDHQTRIESRNNVPRTCSGFSASGKALIRFLSIIHLPTRASGILILF